MRTVLDAVLQEQPGDGSGTPMWGYRQFLLAVEAGKVTAVQFCANGTRAVAVDNTGARFEVEKIPPDSDILDILSKMGTEASSSSRTSRATRTRTGHPAAGS